MSGGPPQFDHAKAQAVIDKAHATIKVLSQQTGNRVSRADKMQKTWTGHYANQFFDTEVPRMKRQAHTLTTELQRLIKQMSNASDAASQASATWMRSHQPTATPGPTPTPPAPGH